MAPQSPENGSFLSRLIKRLIHSQKDIVIPIPSEVTEATGSTKPKKRTAADPDAAKEIIDKMKKITPSHKANEIFNGVDFSEQALSQNLELRSLLLDLIYRSDENTFGAATYHQTKWLEDIDSRITELETTLKGKPEDVTNLKKLKANVENLLEQATSTDERLTEREVQFRKAYHGDAVSSADIFQQAIAFVRNDRTPEGEVIAQAVEAIGGTPITIEHFNSLQQAFEQQGVVMMKRVNQEEPRAMEQFAKDYEHMQRAHEKMGRLFVEQFPMKDRFAYEYRQQGSKLEKALHEDPDLMDYTFYKILEPVLYNEHLESHQALYNLYTMGDMEAFLDVVSKKKDAQGRNIGKELAGYYTTLKNCILQSHDMDYYAAHPMLDMKEFMSSTAMFTNEYINFAHQDPLVALAKRAYEVALLQIREDHNGYIPREYLTWERGRMVSKLDSRVEKIVTDAIRNGQLFHEKIDPVTGKSDTNRWGRVRTGDKPYTLEELYGGQPKQSSDWKRQLGDLKISASLKQAKGLALVDMRLLEIIGRSKGTGSDAESVEQGNYTFESQGFNSVPYEGIVKHIEPIIHHFTRWRIAKENYLPFFSMLITEKDHSWDGAKIKRLIELHREGDHETMRKEFGDEIDTRLLAMDNPFAFSGMWGTMTGWRIADSTVGWDDWEREKYSTANKLMTTGNRFIKQGGHEHGGGHGQHEIPYAPGRALKKVIEYFLYEDDRYKGADGKTAKQLCDQFKKEYRERLQHSNDWDLIRIAGDNNEFEVKWQTVGIKQRDSSSGKTYEALLKDHFDKSVQKAHPKVKEEMKELEMKLERAYKARIWVQAAMRSPLIVARECKAAYNIAGYDREGPLRKKIIYDLLGIDLDEFNRIGTPTVGEMHILDTVTDIEAAVFSIQQVALRENRDLTLPDFDTIADTKLKDYAIAYWKQVKNAMLGDFRSAQEWYREIGIEDADARLPIGLRFHKINWHKINEIDIHNKNKKASIFHHDNGFTPIKDGKATILLNGKLVDRDWRYLFSTEDMGWEYLNMGALGQRNPMRRAGDLGSHVGFNQGLEDILVDMLGGRLPKEDFIKKLKEMWRAMSGDAGETAVEACSRVFYTTMQLYRKYDWAWKAPLVGPALDLIKPTSVMQEIFGKMHGDSLGPNEMLRMIHMAEAAGIFPPHLKSRLTGLPVFPGAPQPNWDGHIMEKRLGATLDSVLYELITMAILASIAITLWRAATAPSEEEESGGGGGNR